MFANNRNKVKLSKQLRLGVGRGYSKNNILKYVGLSFLVVSFLLFGYIGFTILKHQSPKTSSSNSGQVLGATTNPFIKYTVVKGDTIFNVAQKFNISDWASLATINNLAAPYTLKPGQTLLVPNQ